MQKEEKYFSVFKCDSMDYTKYDLRKYGGQCGNMELIALSNISWTDTTLRMPQLSGSWTYSTHNLQSVPVFDRSGHTLNCLKPQPSMCGQILMNAPTWMVGWRYSIMCTMPKDFCTYSVPATYGATGCPSQAGQTLRLECPSSPVDVHILPQNLLSAPVLGGTEHTLKSRMPQPSVA